MSKYSILPNDFESKAKKPPMSGISVKVKKLESLMRLSITDLHRSGVLSSDTPHSITIQYFGKPIGVMKLHACPNFLSVDYPNAIQSKAKPQHIILTRTKCNYGGFRTWFKCPDCKKKIAVLYWQNYFKCRKCTKLHYASQYKSEWDRLCVKAKKIRRDLEGSENMSQPFPDRPKGMHMATYFNRLVEYEVVASKAFSMLRLRS
ncbi:MAG: hypothetical protein COA60_004100 [Robiginitomaculum sp.]|nr:hypothetical protein [Robiginitomaculum sp.]